MKLEKWFIVELSKPIIVGKIFGHPKLPDGIEYSTEYLTIIDIQNNRATSKFNSYNLGCPDPVWLKSLTD